MRPPFRSQSASSNSSPRKTEEQIHYESISDYLKWAIGIAGTLILAMVSVALFVTWGSRKDMEDDYANTVKELKTEIKELKDEARTTTKDIEGEAKETVRTTQSYSDKTLQQIASSTNQLALDETRKELADIFGTSKIQDLIKNQAVEEIKNKVEDIVQEETKDLSKINDAASYMRLGSRKGMEVLQKYFEHPTNKLDSLTAKNLFDEIHKNYIEVRSGDTMVWRNTPTNLTAIDESKPLSEANKRALGVLMQMVNREPDDINTAAGIILYMNKYIKNKFDIFDIEGLNKWYKSIK